MLNNLRPLIFLAVSALILIACGEGEAPATSASSETAPVAAAPEVPPAVIEESPPVMEPVTETVEVVTEPTTEPATEAATETVEPAVAFVAEPVSTAPAPDTVTEAPAQPATETPVAETTTTETPASTPPIDGGQIYNTYCAICHKAGMNAAPKFGSKPLWAKRIAQGRETVYVHAINGLRGMPPRGGFADLTDEQVKAGVDYMVNASGGWGSN